MSILCVDLVQPLDDVFQRQELPSEKLVCRKISRRSGFDDIPQRLTVLLDALEKPSAEID
jgi:hypothetical protein